MSRNTDAVKSIYESFAREDVPATLTRLSADLEWEHDWGAETLKWFGPRRGRESIAGFFATLADFDFIRFEPFAFLEGDGRVAVPARLALVVKSSGRRIRDL